MLRKMMLWLVLATVVIVVHAGSVQAATSAVANIELRCTVTLSVSLVDGNSAYNFGDVSAASVVYSTASITFRNDSTGAICVWDLNVDNSSLNGWQLSDAPGLDRFAVSGVFRKTGQPTADMFEVGADTFSVVAKQYNTVNFHDADYTTDGLSGQAGMILPKSYADTVGLSADRQLWLKLETPLAVTDQTQRTIHVVVTAALANP